MILSLHVAVALAGIICTAGAYFLTSRVVLKASYIFVGLTVASGTWLALSNSAHIVQACISGLTYLGVVFFGITLVRSKLARASK